MLVLIGTSPLSYKAVMSKHHPGMPLCVFLRKLYGLIRVRIDLIMCRRQPGIGRLDPLVNLVIYFNFRSQLLAAFARNATESGEYDRVNMLVYFNGDSAARFVIRT